MNELHLIIVSQPGVWQRVLLKMIESYPYVKVDNVVSGSLSAAQLAKEKTPDAMLIDSSITLDDATALVRNLKHESPKTRIIVILDTTQQRREIALAGADYALSSFNLEPQMEGIFNRIKKSQTEAKKNPGSPINIDPE
jgi:chemotaxis response regulator CheB